jgi:putative PIN family toxin of toxin-antitoxin system
MIRVVIDTNVMVSAALNDRGLPAGVVSLALDGKILMFVSAPILSEYKTVLTRPELKLHPDRVKNLLDAIRRRAQVVKPTRTIAEIKKDEPDNRFLECAAASRAQYLVTGNRRHFPEAFEGTAIVTPKQFTDLILPLIARTP